MSDRRIFRAQSKQYEYFIPSALRCQNYKWLVNNIDMPKHITNIDPCNIDNQSSTNKPQYTLNKNSIRAYYLSIKNIIKAIHQDKCLQNCEEFSILDSDIYRFFKDHHDGRMYSCEESIEEFDRNFSKIGCRLSSYNQIECLDNQNREKQDYGIKNLEFLKLSSYFQHLNHRKGTRNDVDLNCGMKVNYYPTMCLDFSDSIDTMKKWGFITKDSVVYSINLDEVPQTIYYSYLQKYDYKIYMNSEEFEINKNNNVLMKEQHGYCIYWPWKYTVEELQKNRMFGFKIENINNVCAPFFLNVPHKSGEHKFYMYGCTKEFL